MGARSLNRFFTIACVVLAMSMAGCKSKSDDSGLVTTDTGLSTQETTFNNGAGAAPIDGQQIPGSAQDFVVNVGDRVFFGYDQYDLTPEARLLVERQAQWFKQYPATNAVIEGHCDERGTREYNLALGEKRALTVRNYLIANGVETGRLQTISYGKERPAVLGSDEGSWAQNRRAVIVVQ